MSLENMPSPPVRTHPSLRGGAGASRPREKFGKASLMFPSEPLVRRTGARGGLLVCRPGGAAGADSPRELPECSRPSISSMLESSSPPKLNSSSTLSLLLPFISITRHLRTN